RDQHEDALPRNQRLGARNRLFEQRSLAVDRKQWLRAIGAALGPEASAAAARNDEGSGCSDRGDSPLLSAFGRRPAHRALCHQTCAPNSFSLPSNRVRISPSVFWSRASKRSTSAGCVLEARTRPHPPGKFTRAP